MIWFLIGFSLGFLIGWDNKKCPVPYENESENKKLREDVEYYKKLCKWHVEDKEKIKNESLH